MTDHVQRYISVMSLNRGRTFNLVLTPTEVGIVHGAVKLMLSHPNVVQDRSQAFKDMAQGIREEMLRFYRQMGFTQEDIDHLDRTWISEETPFMNLKTTGNRQTQTVHIKCPDRGGEEINVLTCTQTSTIEGKDGPHTDWECPYFIGLYIGSVDCSYPIRLPRFEGRGNREVSEE